VPVPFRPRPPLLTVLRIYGGRLAAFDIALRSPHSPNSRKGFQGRPVRVGVRSKKALLWHLWNLWPCLALAKHLPPFQARRAFAFRIWVSISGGRGAALACGSGAIEDSIFHWHVLQPAQGTELACFLCVCGSPTADIPAATQLILSLVDLATSAAANPGPTRANQGQPGLTQRQTQRWPVVF